MTEHSMQKPSLTVEQKTFLEELALAANEKLITAGQDSANRAFNVGCSVGLLPALIFVVLTLIITKGSWIAVGLIGGMMTIGLLAFANLSAYISRSRAYQRAYQQEILPEIERELGHIGIDHLTFEKVATGAIPPGAPLQTYLSAEYSDEASLE